MSDLSGAAALLGDDESASVPEEVEALSDVFAPSEAPAGESLLPELAEESEGEDAFPAEVVSLFAVSFVPCCPDEETFALPLLPVCVAVLPVPAVFDVPEEEAAPAVPVVLADGAFDEANARVFCLDALAEEGEPEEVTEEAPDYSDRKSVV